MKSKHAKIIFRLLGPLIFIYILLQIDYRSLFQVVKSIKWLYLLLALVLILLEFLIKTLRWRVVLSSLGIFVSRICSLNLCWIGDFVGTITPGKVGELIKIYFLKNRGYSVFRSFLSIILEKIINVLTILFFGLLIYFFFLREIGFYITIISIILVIGVIFLFLLANHQILLANHQSIIYKIFGKFIQKIIPENFNRFTIKNLWHGVKEMNKKEIFYFIFYLSVSWSLYFYSRYMIARAIGLNLSFVNIFVISIVVTVVAILPISVAGMGTREAAIIYLFTLFNLSKETAVLFSLLIFATNTIIVSFGVIPYLKESILISKVKKIDDK